MSALGLIFLQYFDLAADVLAENAHLTYKYLTPVRSAATNAVALFLCFCLLGSNLPVSCLFQYIYEFLDALLMSQTTPEEVVNSLKCLLLICIVIKCACGMNY